MQQPPSNESEKRKTYRELTRIGVTIIILPISLYMVFGSANADPATKQLASGFIGALIGYWIR